MTLVEVLVATVVIAIGLLGIATLQITALQGASNADYRSRAIDLASALSDRMHANLDGVADNNFSPYTSTTADCASVPNPICAMTPNDGSTGAECTPAQMAAFDLWKIGCGNAMQSSLPGGRLSVTCLDNDASDSDDCTDLSPMLITVSWQLQSDTNASDEVVMTVIPGAP